MVAPRIGVLAIQGDFALHGKALKDLGARVTEVRTAAALEGLDGLVLPGGESTTMLKLLGGSGIPEALRRFVDNGGALFGTCAGLILLAREVTDPIQESLGLLDLTVARNGYGRQVDSFETDLSWRGSPLRAVFIRAPRITRVGAEVKVLLRHGEDPVLVREGRILGATFHPEAAGEGHLHRYFLESVVGARTGVEEVG